MTMDWSLHPERIRDLLQSDTMEMDAPTEEWITALNAAGDTHGHDVVLAWTIAMKSHDLTATISPDDLSDEIERVYRQEWETPGAFVAGRIAEDEKEYGELGERRGFEKFVRMFGEHVDWDAAADDPEVMGSYHLVMLDPENSRTVHAFEMDA